MGKISISSELRAQMDTLLPNTKSTAFPVGTTISITGIREASYTVDGKELPNHKLEVRIDGEGHNGTKMLMPVREFLKASNAEAGKDVFTEENGQAFFPSKVKITKAEDRKSRDGKEIYPVQAYNAFEAQLEANARIDWNTLVASGVKADNTLKPVQNYEFSIED